MIVKQKWVRVAMDMIVAVTLIQERCWESGRWRNNREEKRAKQRSVTRESGVEMKV